LEKYFTKNKRKEINYSPQLRKEKRREEKKEKKQTFFKRNVFKIKNLKEVLECLFLKIN